MRRTVLRYTAARTRCKSFAIDNVEVKSDDAVVVLPGAKLAVEQAKTEEPGAGKGTVKAYRQREWRRQSDLCKRNTR